MKKSYWLFGFVGLVIGLVVSGVVFHTLKKQALAEIPTNSLKYYRVSSVLEAKNNAFSIHDQGLATTDTELMTVTPPTATFNDPAIYYMEYRLTNGKDVVSASYFHRLGGEQQTESENDLINFKPRRLNLKIKDLTKLRATVLVHRDKKLISKDYQDSYPKQEEDSEATEELVSEDGDTIINQFTYKLTLKPYFDK